MWKSVKKVWHIFWKAVSFFTFGTGCILLAFGLFPLMWLLIHPRSLYIRAMRATISFFFRVFVLFMRLLGVISLRFENKEHLKNAKGLIICANHPSLLDVVMMISVVPNADCIVNQKLFKNPFIGFVIKNVYIPNSTSPEDTINRSAASLAQGNNLIIFPEGTRTVQGEPLKFRRSSAQISLRSNRNILPIGIKTNDPVGLRKGDSFFVAPEEGVVSFVYSVGNEIEVDIYDQKTYTAAKILTDELKSRIMSLLN